MSGFDDSPFGDPFKDPSITQATSRPGTDATLDDYNPFANNVPKQQPIRGASNPPPIMNEPAVLETNGGNLTGNVGGPASSAQSITQADLMRRQEELDRKAAELQAREDALRNQEGAIRIKNFPPIPAFCPFDACFYQDISVDIPVEFQRVVRHCYYLWIYYCAILLLDLIASIVKWSMESDGGTSFFSSLICLVFFAPASYVCWFRPVYKAFKNDSSFNFMVFFLVFFAQLVLSVFWAIGIPASSTFGLVTGLYRILNSHATIGQTFWSLGYFAVAIAWCGFVLFEVYIFQKVHHIFRTTGASLEKARAEFSSGVMNNQHVQQAAAGAARNAMSGAFTGNGTNGTSGVKY